MFKSKKAILIALIAIIAIAVPVLNARNSSACEQIKDGVLTIGTDDPAYEPWFSDNDPANGKGFEGAVAYAVAEKLGYSADKVEWVRVTFNNVIAPGCKTFDFDINQFTITDERATVIDFSSSYYNAPQAVITTADSKFAGAKTLADLKGAKLGAQVGTTSLAAITDLIKPDQDPAVFDTNDVAKQALINGQIDALVLDLPTASYVAPFELENGVILGQLATTDQFGIALPKGSAFTKKVSEAVDALRADGTLAKLEKQWLSSYLNTPELK